MLFDYLIDNSTNSQLNSTVKERSDSSKGLVSLDISNNHLGPPSGVIIAKAFLSGLALQHLNLSRCRIGDEGAIAISKSLSSLGSQSTLETLNLSYCGIGNEGEQDRKLAM
jgi:Ran GTPase-activating protein (RanGAP) involved in mRNA processing and transport